MHIARKRFGQNFLVDDHYIHLIIDALALRRDDQVVEIGPGLGALTEPMLARLEHLHVVELDRDLAARLRQRHVPAHLTVHEADALTVDFSSLGNGLRLVGNLPYNISTPLLFHLMGFAGGVRDMTFMLQKEVVDRMVAEPGSADYGRLSVMLQWRFLMARLFLVPPGAFRPAPKVDSAVVRMGPKPAAEIEGDDFDSLARVVTAAFSQRRKMLRNTLKGLFTPQELQAQAIDPMARPEELALDDYRRLAAAFAQRQATSHQPGG